MERSKLVPLAFALVLVAASGCLGAGTDDPTNSNSAITGGMDDSAVRSAFVAATEDVDSYTATIETANSGNGYDTESTYRVTVDREAQRARWNGTTETNGEAYNTTAVIDPPVVYSTNESRGNWTRHERSGVGAWENIDQLSMYVTLADRSNATVVGSTTIDGEGATVLEADVDRETYMSVVAGENASTTPIDGPNVTASLRLVVDNETAVPQTLEMQTTTVSEYGNYESTTTMTIEDHGPATQIETPQDTVTATVRTGSEGGTTTVVTASAPPTEEE
jgi:outer membrane lipoprotein-sorting protein